MDGGRCPPLPSKKKKKFVCIFCMFLNDTERRDKGKNKLTLNSCIVHDLVIDTLVVVSKHLVGNTKTLKKKKN